MSCISSSSSPPVHSNPTSLFKSPAMLKRLAPSPRPSCKTFVESPHAHLVLLKVFGGVCIRPSGIQRALLHTFLQISMISVHDKFDLTRREWWTQFCCHEKQNPTTSNSQHPTMLSLARPESQASEYVEKGRKSAATFLSSVEAEGIECGLKIKNHSKPLRKALAHDLYKPVS